MATVTETLKWIDEKTPDCERCRMLLENPLMAQAFYDRIQADLFDRKPSPRGVARIQRFHIDGHQLRPSGDGN